MKKAKPLPATDAFLHYPESMSLEERENLAAAETLALAKEKKAKPQAKRTLRVSKWLSTTPAIGVCTACSREFKVPMTSLHKTADAQVSFQEQFERHKCQSEDVG
jgi:hypothetical protein